MALADELDGRDENTEEYGTRAKGTESFVYRILQTPAYRTEEIIARFLDAAITPAQPQDTIRKRARKLLSLIAKHGDSAIPGEPQPRVSDLMRGKISKFSLEALIKYADALKMRPEIKTHEPVLLFEAASA